MIEVGQPVPDVRVWGEPGEPVELGGLHADGPYLLVFYLLDWSAT